MVLSGLMAAAPADKLVVPVELQVDLLGKVLRYDRNFADRVLDEVRVLVVHEPDDAESIRVAREYAAAIGSAAKLGGVKARAEVVAFGGDAELVARVKERKAAVIVFTPSFAARAASLAAQLEGTDALTVSATPDGVREGFVLGFDLVSGKPRMLFNLSRSRRQGADFRAEVLRLMTVFP
jgi:hypothetical protein